MLSKSAAKKFFLLGTGLCVVAFLLLTLDTLKQIPGQTNEINLNESAKRGKHLWDKNNCMGCHTIMGEGAYYAPELTKVYERRGSPFIHAMLTDPEKMYPGERKMQKYNFSEQEKTDLIEFLKWIGEMDLNGFPPKPDFAKVTQSNLSATKAPEIYSKMCTACHAMGGQGGTIGPALDEIRKTRNKEYLVNWLKDPNAVKPGAKMAKLPLTDSEINQLADFLSQQDGSQK